jgi:hypothetical protein
MQRVQSVLDYIAWPSNQRWEQKRGLKRKNPDPLRPHWVMHAKKKREYEWVGGGHVVPIYRRVLHIYYAPEPTVRVVKRAIQLGVSSCDELITALQSPTCEVTCLMMLTPLPAMMAALASGALPNITHLLTPLRYLKEVHPYEQLLSSEASSVTCIVVHCKNTDDLMDYNPFFSCLKHPLCTVTNLQLMCDDKLIESSFEDDEPMDHEAEWKGYMDLVWAGRKRRKI